MTRGFLLVPEDQVAVSTRAQKRADKSYSRGLFFESMPIGPWVSERLGPGGQRRPESAHH
jgi:hypothetical protein